MPTTSERIIAEAIAFWSACLFRSEASARARDYLLGERRVSLSIANAFHAGHYRLRDTASHLLRRGFTRDEITASRVLWQSFDDWLVFPWFDAEGTAQGFVFRALPGTNTPLDRLGRRTRYAFTGNRDVLPLYGLSRALQAGHKHLVMVEGTIDVLALQSAGLTNVVGPNSCQLRVWHASALKQSGIEHVTLCLDSDVPGQRGTLRAIEAAMAAELPVSVAPVLPDDLDPDELIAARGPNAFRHLIQVARNGLVMYAEHILATVSKPAEALQAGAEFQTLRAPVRSDLDLRAWFWPVLAESMALTFAEIDKAVAVTYRRKIAERQARRVPQTSEPRLLTA